MKTLPYRTYSDRVYGCFLGKCVGGTAGGPAEGRKELLDFPLDEALLHTALPNDDLDLQILWLELLETKGPALTARSMAKEFYEKVPYGPGEYGFFKKNYGRGVYPPLSGSYNNRYYLNGMGCPIRSEIWACLFPGAVERAVPYIRMDGSLDHLHDSIEAEIFLASMESEAFFCTDLDGILDRSLARLTKDSKLDRVLCMTRSLWKEGRDWRFTRAMILRRFGHADCTNLYQNLGFILLALLYGKGDFRETVRLGLACGYDTDCICASAASVLGAMQGAEKLLSADGLSDTGLKITVLTRRREGSIRALAEDVCRAGLSMMAEDGEVKITGADVSPSLPVSAAPAPYTVEAEYDGAPVLRPTGMSTVTLNVRSSLDEEKRVTLSVTAPDGVSVVPECAAVEVPAKGCASVRLAIGLKPGETVLWEKNLFNVRADDGERSVTDTFGLVGCAVWYRYGPFLMNNRALPDVPPHKRYSPYLTAGPGETVYDVTRDFHLNNFADPDRAFVDETLPFDHIPSDGRAECVPELFAPEEDRFDTAEIGGFEGPHTDYLVRILVSPEDREVELAVGHTTPFRLWLNGALVGEDRTCTWWTAENRHFSVRLNKGENVMILKCSQVSDSAKFSVIPRKLNGRWQQWEDFGSALKIPE